MRHRLKQQLAALLSAVMLFTMQPAAMAENIDISDQVFAGQTQISEIPETKELPEDDGTDGGKAQIDTFPNTEGLQGNFSICNVLSNGRTLLYKKFRILSCVLEAILFSLCYTLSEGLQQACFCYGTVCSAAFPKQIIAEEL